MPEHAESYIRVAVALPVERNYLYHVPPAFHPPLQPGMRVLVPFGRRRVTGFVIRGAEPDHRYAIKSILDLLDTAPLFPESMIPFFEWIAGYYLHPPGLVIKSALPAGLDRSDHLILKISSAGRDTLETAAGNPMETAVLGCLAERPRRPREIGRALGMDIPAALLHRIEAMGWVVRERRLKGGTTGPKMTKHVTRTAVDPPADLTLSGRKSAILDLLSERGTLPVSELNTHIAGAGRLIPSLEQEGLVTVVQRTLYRDPFGAPIAAEDPKDLTAQQAEAFETVSRALNQGYAAFLLAGVTGSGKTEVYLQLAEKAVASGLGVLVLVPEIALISQMERRFRARFGERIAVLHSRLSPGERYDQWERIRTGAASIAVGVRSAVFAPFHQIGLIIVDEEHDGSYKSGTELRYHARDLAVTRAKLLNTVVLLGSATPSVQSWHNVRSGKYRLLRLTRRVAERPLPAITIVDLRKMPEQREAGFLTAPLVEAMTETLARGEQVLLFLNRRGYAGFPICSECGETIRCRHCDVTLTYHQHSHRYQCHYCGYTRQGGMICPACGQGAIRFLGLGTEKLEGVLRNRFPSARILRMDRDTVARKGALVQMLKKLRKGEADILVGTQMVSKGHDFPDVTLVGILCADLTLNFPDFRAAERTFQLLAQVAGRAGRGERPGRVILQTYMPEHFSIQAARRQDFETFFDQEIRIRQALHYPPLARLIQILVWGRDAVKVEQAASLVGEAARTLLHTDPLYAAHLQILGPVTAPIPRLSDRYRWHILVKAAQLRTLRRFLDALKENLPPGMKLPGARMVIDVDPYDLM